MCSSPSAAQEKCVYSDKSRRHFIKKSTSGRGCFIEKGVYFKTFLKGIQSKCLWGEVGLIVPGIFQGRTKSKACARIVQEKLTRMIKD